VGHSWQALCRLEEESMNRRILVVDDERRTLLLMTRTLRDLQEEHEELEIEVLTAADGEQALQVIAAQRPVLVYLDLMMPRVGGLEVCRKVKHDMGMHDVRIVILTAMGQQVDEQRAHEAGADLYMTKPFDPDAVVAIARDVLGL
jgi:two-component system, OmpR family, alkaline phosphatase synthesis response regulator PhoP